MAYASIPHVVAVNAARGGFTATSIPNSTQVVMFIDEAAGMMDSMMTRNKYSVPIDLTSAPSSVCAELQRMNAVGAAYMVECSAQVTSKKDEFQSMWESALKMLEEDELPGIEKTSSTALPRFDDGYPTPMFFRDMDL